MERETGFEPATSTLARSHSTTELFPLDRLKYHTAALSFNPRRTDSHPPTTATCLSRLHRHRTKHACRLFRRGGIDVEPGPPLEARDLGELRHELQMPVIKIGRLLRKRGAVDDEIVRRRFERAVDAHQHGLEEPRQTLVLVPR